MSNFDNYVEILKAIAEDIKSENHENDEKHIKMLRQINEDFVGELNDFLTMSNEERLIIHRLMNYICSLVSDIRGQLLMNLGHYCALEGLCLQCFQPKEETKETKETEKSDDVTEEGSVKKGGDFNDC